MKNCRVIKFIKENIIISTVLTLMAIIYIFRMFTNGPWYDELYTYYSFISRGVVYSAIHWPVPNNHVGYSVLSAFLNIFGNPYISLRGVSFLASLANILLIYKFCIRFTNKYYGVFAAMLYAGANIIHMLAVQGRGYSLAVTCFLTAGMVCHNICMGADGNIPAYFCEKSAYGVSGIDSVKTMTPKYKMWLFEQLIIFSVSLTMGLYILPSSIYWVLPVCMAGGIYLLIEKRFKILTGLIISSSVSALDTLFLYGTIWLAIGSNLLSKTEGSGYFGVYQLNIIKSAPFKALKTGMDYMLGTPYIQSIERSQVLKEISGYFVDFFNQCYKGCGIVFIILWCAIIVFGAYRIFDKRDKYIKKKKLKEIGITDSNWLEIYLLTLLIVVPLLMILQSVLPYKRVLGFIMVPMAMGVAYVLWYLGEVLLKDSPLKDRLKKIRKHIGAVPMLIMIIYVTFLMTTYDYIKPMADRENHIAKILEQVNVEDISSIYYTDDFQKYVLKFYYDTTPIETGIEEAKYVMVSKELLDESYDSPQWPLLMPYNKEFLDTVKQSFDLLAESEEYRVYGRK